VRDYDAEVAAASKGGFDFARMVNDVASGLGIVGDKAGDVVSRFSTLEEAEKAVWEEFNKGNTASISFSDGLYLVHSTQKTATESSDKLAESTKNTAEAAKVGSKEWKAVQDVLLETQKQTDDFSVKMAQLSNERFEISVKADVDLKVAQIQADTARITAAFQASSEAINALTKGATDLWVAAGSRETTGWNRLDLQHAAERMEARLDEELALKRELTNSVMSQSIATSNRLNSGAPLISIDAGTLAPELELIFDKILKFTQIKATQEGLSLLVGL